MTLAWGGTQPIGAWGRRDFNGKLTIHRIHLDGGGYTRSGWVGAGKYFGTGAPLWSVEDEEGNVSFFIRARDLTSAKAIVREAYPNAKGLGGSRRKHRA